MDMPERFLLERKMREKKRDREKSNVIYRRGERQRVGMRGREEKPCNLIHYVFSC